MHVLYWKTVDREINGSASCTFVYLLAELGGSCFVCC